MALTSNIFVLFCIFLIGCRSSYAAKLNVPKVLLPYYSSIASNFTLEVSEGCYTWRTSRPEVAAITPLNVQDAASGCATQAVVTAVSKTPTRMTSIVIAEDPVSGQKLRCDVIVDVIHSIEIETTTRELYLEDSPESFSVRGVDDEGNTFSTLEGVSFEWNLISDTDVEQEAIVDAHNILRILTFTESSYETPTHIGMMEDRGLQGNMILVEGIKTGSAKVSTRLKDPVYKGVVPATEVRLIVIANLMLNPPLVYILKHTQVQYKVELVKQGKTQEIPMPSPQYYLEVKNPELASLNTAVSTVTGTEYGYTEIILKDRNIKIKEAFRQPSAGIYVVTPGYLGFSVFPGRKWVLETDRDYDIYIEIYNKDSHKIFPSDNVRVNAVFPEEYFKVYHSSINGTYHRVRTLKRGFTEIEGILKSVITESGEEVPVTPPIKNSQDLEIYDPIKVEPPVLVFPWDPVNRASYQYALKASGGSGNYSWVSANPNVAAVNVKGEISTNQIGDSVVTAADVRNTAHTASMIVHVLPPTDMQFVPHHVEAEIGSHLELPLAVFGQIGQGGERHMYDDCRNMPFKIRIADTGVFADTTELLPVRSGSCATIKVRALRQGNTQVLAEYEHGKVRLKASVTIAAYRPLKPIDPESVAVVAVGSSKEVIFDGGPQPWVLDPSKFYQKIDAQKAEILHMKHLQANGVKKYLHIFHVVCKDLGEQSLTVSVGNGPTSRNKHPAHSEASVKFSCSPPVGLHLEPVVRQPELGLPPCPITQDSSQIPVHSYRDLDILVTVTDSNGRKFDNFSSLAFDWQISDQSLASFANNGEMTMALTTTELGRKIQKCFQILMMSSKLGSLTVTATIARYNTRYFEAHGIAFPENIQPPISRSLDLLLVEDAKINPESISIFNHPSNKVALQISKGSGHFHIDTGTGKANVADVYYDSMSKKVQVSPLLDGSFTLTVYDLCLETDEHAHADIHISGINVVELRVVDKVELGKEISAHVRVLDRQGNPLLASYFSLMSLKPLPGLDIITLRAVPSKNPDQFTAAYLVKGVVLGQTTLTFSANIKAGQSISSAPKDIQVFPPLRLYPRNITLISGALFQVTAHGGPQPQSTIEYYIGDRSIADISSTGVVEAEAIGNTVVTGKAVGRDSVTGETVVYSQDQVTVYVVELPGIRIFAPLTRLQTGTQMPVYAVGMNEHETPFTFGSALPPLKFYWSINNKEVAQLASVYHQSNIKVPPQSNFAQRFFAQREGHVTIRLQAKPSPGSQLQIRDESALLDEVQIQVFEKLTLMNPESCTGQMIVSHNTDTQLKTNRDVSARLSYKVVSQRSSRKSSTTPVISVNEAGQLVSGSVSGEAVLQVTAHEDFGVNQSIVILVKVKPISYMMLNVDTVVKTDGGQITSIPVGAVLHFSVSYHDDVGAKFDAATARLKYRPNRFDLLQVTPGSENHTLVARATDLGQTVLKVWDRTNPHIADYISIDVSHAIEPAQAVVTLGDVICFSSPLVAKSGDKGHWSSSSNAIHTSHRSGVATATQVGSAVIRYTVGDTATHTEVVVAPIDKISLKADNVLFLSNVPTRSGFSVFTVVVNGTSIRGRNCSEHVSSEGHVASWFPFRCELSMEPAAGDLNVMDVLQVEPGFDAMRGTYFCNVSQVSGDASLLQEISALDVSVKLRAVVTAREQQSKMASNVLSLPFLPAFHVYTSEVQLNNLLPLSSVRLSAVQSVKDDITLSVSDPSILEVLSPERDPQSQSATYFPIRLLERAALYNQEEIAASVLVKCSTTGQQVTVPITIKMIGQRQDGKAPSTQYSQQAGWGRLFTIITDNCYPALFTIILLIILSILLKILARSPPSNYQTAGANSGVFLAPGSPYQQTQQQPFQPSPWSSPYHTGTSPSKIPLWSSGYEPADTSTSILKRSPANNRSPYK